MENDIKKTINLVLQAKTGDENALNLLMQRYLQRILRIVRMRLGPKLREKMESMDVVQEVMVRAIKGFENFEPKDEAAFLHWIGKLVQNEIRDLADYHGAAKRNADLEIKKKENNENFGSVITNLPADSLYKPSVQFRLKDDVLKLEAALDQLPEKQKEVVIMRNFEGLTFGEIGTEMDCSEDAARMQFARAIDRLTDLMAE